MFFGVFGAAFLRVFDKLVPAFDVFGVVFAKVFAVVFLGVFGVVFFGVLAGVFGLVLVVFVADFRLLGFAVLVFETFCG